MFGPTEVTETHLEVQFQGKHKGWTRLCSHNPDTTEEGLTWLAEWRLRDSVPKRLARVTTTIVMEEVAA